MELEDIIAVCCMFIMLLCGIALWLYYKIVHRHVDDYINETFICHDPKPKNIKLKFERFLSFYSLNPDRYEIIQHKEHVIATDINNGERIVIWFSKGRNRKKFCKFRDNFFKDQTEKKQNLTISEYLQSVKKDIKNTEKTAKEYRDMGSDILQGVAEGIKNPDKVILRHATKIAENCYEAPLSSIEDTCEEYDIDDVDEVVDLYANNKKYISFVQRGMKWGTVRMKDAEEGLEKLAKAGIDSRSAIEQFDLANKDFDKLNIDELFGGRS